MRKILFIISLLFIIVFGTSCNQNKLRIGMLADYDKSTKIMISDLLVKNSLVDNSNKITYVKIKNFDEAFFNLTNNKIDLLISDETSSKYYCNRHNELVYKVLDNSCVAKHSLCFSDQTKYLLDSTNQIIQDFKDERFLESLNNIYVTSVIDNEDPSYIDLVKIPYSSRLYRVGFTGNLPPIDLIDESDRPCGYSNKFINEIAKRMKVNLILVKLDSDTKVKALKNHDVDFLYEVTAYNNDCKETGDDLYISIPYYQSPISYITLR